MWVLRVLAAAAGLWMVGGTLVSAIQTVVLPRAAPVFISRVVFVGVRTVFTTVAHERRTFADRDRVMALYGPLSLIILPGVWVLLVLLGYTALFWGSGIDPLSHAFEVSGSSLLTLGWLQPEHLYQSALAFSEATLGFGLVGLLISYLPSIYAAFARRETQVGLLEVRAGTPPSVAVMLQRHHRIGELTRLDDLWRRWELWFADIEESHSSIATLCFFRSHQLEHSWITAAGCVLDTAAFVDSAIDMPRQPSAQLCLRSGYVALRRIADVFGIDYDADPAPGDQISVLREEYDEVWDTLAAEGLPMKPDRERAWRDFNGWRVNYDRVLIVLAGLVMAPPAPWSSDRSLRYKRPPMRKFARR